MSKSIKKSELYNKLIIKGVYCMPNWPMYRDTLKMKTCGKLYLSFEPRHELILRKLAILSIRFALKIFIYKGVSARIKGLNTQVTK